MQPCWGVRGTPASPHDLGKPEKISKEFNEIISHKNISYTASNDIEYLMGKRVRGRTSDIVFSAM